MNYILTGQKLIESNFPYGCKILIGTKSFSAYVTSKYWEFVVLDGQSIQYQSRYVCDSLLSRILDLGYYVFFDSNKKEIFRLCKRGAFRLKTAIVLDGKEYILPRNIDFSLDAIGFQIEIKDGKFIASVKNTSHIGEDVLGVGLLLSYYCWLRQQRWEDID